MVIPATGGDGDEGCTLIDELAGKEAAGAEGGVAVAIQETERRGLEGGLGGVENDWIEVGLARGSEAAAEGMVEVAANLNEWGTNGRRSQGGRDHGAEAAGASARPRFAAGEERGLRQPVAGDAGPERADDLEAVGEACQAWEVLAERDTGDGSGDGAEGSSDVLRGVGLRVEAVEGAKAPLQPEEDATG